jgi:hypothetical protein
MERRKGLSIIAGERAIKPLYYIRNGVLHARYNVDRAIELTQEDETEIKALLSLPEADKQNILSAKWKGLQNSSTVIMDGISYAENRFCKKQCNNDCASCKFIWTCDRSSYKSK